MSNDPYATGNDGLALSDSANPLDTGPAWNIPASGYGAGPAWDIPISPDITASGLPWATGSGSAGTPGQTGYFTQPPSNAGSGSNRGTASTHPGKGWSGTPWPNR